METSPPMKRRKQSPPLQPQSPLRLFIPLESGLNNNPDHPQGGLDESSFNSPESEGSLPGDPVEGVERVPQTSKTLDTNLNFPVG